MSGSKSLTDDDALVAIKFLSYQLDLCLVRISCLDKASGQFTAPNISALLGQSQAGYWLSWLAISTASQVDSILFTDLDAETFIKLIRKLNRGPGALEFKAAVSLIGSADACNFYQNATLKAPHLLQVVLKAALKADKRRLRAVGYEWEW
jgi:hypothetical protein